MLSRERSFRASERGMTLVETLVAITVFTIVFLAALGLYQAANRAYMATDAATIQQQNARFAMDRVSETLRDAGANYSPTGKANVADEQVEGAWESALFVRGDFDNSRETALEDATFPMVTVGNDEIVGYVLRKPVVTDNTVSITIKADLTPPTGRDAVKSGTTITGEETGTIKVAASDLAGQTNPPYQLARVTFDDSGNPVYQVIAENIFRMSFKYMDETGAEVIKGGATPVAAGSADADRATRATVRKIGVSLTSMTDRADFGYTDPGDYTTDAFGHTAPAEGAASKPYRKLTLTEEIFGVSLGRKGARHNAVPAVVIDPPPSLTVCTGHHMYFYAKWNASPTSGIATYALHITASSPSFDYTVLVPTTEYRFKQIDATVQNYSFQVAGAAVSTVGTYSGTVSKATWHDTVNSIPNVPTNVAASGFPGSNAMQVTWTPVTTNTGTVTDSTACTTIGVGAGNSAPTAPWNTEAVDLGSYQVYRGLYYTPGGTLTGGFTPAAGNRIDSQVIGDITNTQPTFGSSFNDNTAAPCGQYWYRMKAFDTAGLVAPGDGSTAMATAAKYIPASGITPAKPGTPAPVGTVGVTAGNYTFTLGWADDVRDSAGNKATTAHYQVERESAAVGYNWSSPGTAMTPLNAYEVATVSDSVPITSDYRYRVKAIYDCGAVGDTDRTSPVSDWYYLSCVPAAGNTITISVPGNGVAVSRPYETGFNPQATVAGAGWTAATMKITNAAGTQVYLQTLSAAPNASNQYNFPFFDVSDTTAYPDGTYTALVTGYVGACKTTATSTFTLDQGNCGLEISAPVWNATNGSSAFQELRFNIKNNCDLTPITVSGLKVTWTGALATRFVSSIKYGAVTYVSGLTLVTGANGATIPFTSPNTAVIAAGATSSQFSVIFNGNHTSDGSKNGTPAKFSSILASVTSPLTQTDEILITTPLTP